MLIKLTAAAAVALSIGLSVAFAADPQEIVVTRAGSQPSEAGPEKNFSGSVRVDSRFQAPTPARVGGGIVTFEPGARTKWHTHPLGQTLIVTAGVGRVQEWGDPVQEIRPGDVVWIPPGVKHWHGASPTTGMTHVAISEQLDGKSVDWQEKVSDAQFGSATSNSGRAVGDVNPKLAQLTIQEQGSFAVGGAVVTTPGKFDPIKQGAYNPTDLDSTGQTLHGDHATVFYQVPADAKKLPLVFWHGHGQSMRTWQSTPDGREGFQNIFLRRGFPVYLIDQPRRGLAAKSTLPVEIPAAPDEQLWFGIFRIGAWPNFYDGVQFSKDPEALTQFFRQAVPNTGPYDADVNISSVSALFDKIGEGILVTHSQSGGPGWRTALKNNNIRAIVSYEPGGDFVFPEGEKVEPVNLRGRVIQPLTVPMPEFMKFTKLPIVIYYGDNIPDKADENPGKEQWRVFSAAAKRWAEVVNRHGGDATVVHLPAIGIKGNTHFPFADLNNLEIADQLSKFLREKHLDK